MEQIGLRALFEDADFQRGISAYDKALVKASASTDSASKQMQAGLVKIAQGAAQINAALVKAAEGAGKSTQGLAKGTEEAAKGWDKAGEAAKRYQAHLEQVAAANMKVADFMQRSSAAATQQAKAAAEQSKAALSQIGQTMAVSGGLVTAILGKLALAAAPIEGVADAFEAMAGRAGLSLEKLDAAAAGTINTLELMRLSNVALTGAGDQLAQAFGRDLPRLLEIARAAAKATGQDVDFLFQSLVTGIKRTSPLLIDNTGLQLKMGEANERLAEQMGKTVEEMTGEEKQIAILNATLAAGERMVREFGGAQLTAAEDVARTKASVAELGHDVGSILLPALQAGLGVVQSLIAGFQGLPAPVQETAVQMAAGGAALAAMGGAVAVALPKILALVAALQGMGGMAILGPVGLIAGIAALLSYLANLEQAHITEAAQIANSTQTYNQYIAKLRAAGLENYALAESLYEVAKAQAEASGNSEEYMAEVQAAEAAVQDMLEVLIPAPAKAFGPWDETLQQIGADIQAMLPDLDEFELTVIGNRDALIQYGLANGLTAEQATQLANAIANQVQAFITLKAEQAAVELGLSGIGKAYSIAEEEADKLTGRLQEQEEQAGLTQEQIDALSEAYGRATEMLASFIGSLAGGIAGLRDLDTEAVESAADYESALAGLAEKGRHVYDGLKADFEASLPDATTVEDRLGMAADAWDEWGLRMGALLDGVQGTMEQGWLDALTAVTAGTDLAFQAGEESLAQWMERLREAFYAGDLQELINQDSQAWQENATATAEAQAKATAAVETEAAKRRAAIEKEKADLEAARAEQLAAEQAARDQAMMELSLDLAEASGMLAGWAQTAFGPEFAGAFDTAAEVVDGLKAGLLTLDGPLGEMVGSFASGINDVLAETEGGGQALADTLRGILQGVDEEAQATATAVTEKLSTMGDDVSVEDAKAAGKELAEAMGGGIEEGLPEDPLAAMLGKFQGAAQSIAEQSGLIKTSIDTIPGEHTTDVKARGVENTLSLLAEVKRAIESIPTDVRINVSANYNPGDEMTEPQSPELGIQHALENLVEFVGANFPLSLSLADADVETFRSYGEAVNSLLQALADVAGYTPGLAGMAAFEEDVFALLDALARIQMYAVTSGGARFWFGAGKELPTMEDLFGWVDTVVEAFQGIGAEETAIDAAQIDSFFEDIDLLLAHIAAIAEGRSAMMPNAINWNPIAVIMEKIAASIAPLGLILEATAPLAEYAGIGPERVSLFMADLGEMLTAIVALADAYAMEDLGAATRLAATIALVGSGLDGIMDGMVELSTYAGFQEDALALFERDLPLALDALLRVAARYETEGLEAAADFSDAAGQIAGDVGGAVSGLSRLAEYTGLQAGTVALFERDLPLVLDALLRIAAEFEDQGVEGAEELVAAATSMAGDAGAAVRGMAALTEYTGLRADALALFERDLPLVLAALLRVAEDMATEGLDGSQELLAAATGMAGDVGRAASGMASLAEYAGFEAGALALFEQDLPQVVDALLRVAALYDAEGMEGAEELVGAATSMAADVGRAVGGLADLASYRGVGPGALGRFVEDLTGLVTLLASSLGGLAPGDAERLKAIGETLGAVGQGVGAGFRALVDVATYRGGIEKGLDVYVQDLGRLMAAYAAMEDGLPPGETAESIGATLEALSRGTTSAFKALVDVATYRGGIDQGLEAFISDIYRLVTAFQELGDAVPWFFIPHSPPPLAQGLAAIRRELGGLAVSMPQIINQIHSPTINIGPNTVSGGIGLADFEARVGRTIRRELGVMN